MALLLGGRVGVAAGLVVALLLDRRLRGLESAGAVREARQLSESVPLAADLLGVALAAGTPTSRAARVVGDAVGGPLGRLLVDGAVLAELGAAPRTAWAALGRHASLTRLGRTLVAAEERGSAPVDTLTRLAADARESARWAAEARARALGARAAAPLGLCFLPAFLLVGVVPVVAGAGSLLP